MKLPIEIIKRKNLEKLKHSLIESQTQIENASRLISEFNTTKKLKTTEAPCKLESELSQIISQVIEAENTNKQRLWENEGLNKFNRILRNAYQDFESVSDQILATLCDYLEATQAALLLAKTESKGEEPYLEMVGMYAYNRKKFHGKRLEIGEGLAGEAFLNQNTVYRTEIPDDYLSVGSGLGGSKPKAMLIVPIIHNGESMGILELASFEPFSATEKKFIEKLCVNIASTIYASNNNSQTQGLLKDFQQQTEMLRSQEEELRQNSEELLSTQEEMARKQEELMRLKDNLENEVRTQTLELKKSELALKEQIHESESLIKTIRNFSFVVEFDPSGIITYINDKFLNLFEVKEEEMLGFNHEQFNQLANDPEAYRKFWAKLRTGVPARIQAEVVISEEKTFWLDENYMPLMDSKGKLKSVINIALDITENKRNERKLLEATEELQAHEEELRQSLEEIQATHEELSRHTDELHGYTEAMNDIYAVVEFDKDSTIIQANRRFLDFIGFEDQEVIGKKLMTLLWNDSDEAKTMYKEIWNTVKTEGGLDRLTRRTSRRGEVVAYAHYRPFYNKKGKMTRIICICEDYSHIQKMMGKDFDEAMNKALASS